MDDFIDLSYVKHPYIYPLLEDIFIYLFLYFTCGILISSVVLLYIYIKIGIKRLYKHSLLKLQLFSVFFKSLYDSVNRPKPFLFVNLSLESGVIHIYKNRNWSTYLKIFAVIIFVSFIRLGLKKWFNLDYTVLSEFLSLSIPTGVISGILIMWITGKTTKLKYLKIFAMVIFISLIVFGLKQGLIIDYNILIEFLSNFDNLCMIPGTLLMAGADDVPVTGGGTGGNTSLGHNPGNLGSGNPDNSRKNLERMHKELIDRIQRNRQSLKDLEPKPKSLQQMHKELTDMIQDHKRRLREVAGPLINLDTHPSQAPENQVRPAAPAQATQAPQNPQNPVAIPAIQVTANSSSPESDLGSSSNAGIPRETAEEFEREARKNRNLLRPDRYK